MPYNFRLTLVTSASIAFAFAQQDAPIGIVRGDLVKWDGNASRGELNIRTAPDREVTCGFDAKTYFERDNQRIAPPAMEAGDRLELVADHKPGTTVCYARTVHVIDPEMARRSALRARRERMSPTEAIVPRGDLTFAGVVLRLDPEVLWLKTRTGGEKKLLLRSDTRYLSEGQRVNPANLKVSQRVFIRCGKNLDGDVEAYQIIWGDIIRP